MICQGHNSPFTVHNSANEVSDMMRWSVGLFLLFGALSCGDAEPAAPPAEPVCGDRVKQGDEQCDEGATSAPRCAYGQTSCTVCDQRCQLVVGQLTGYCGDELAQMDQGELCDAGRNPSPLCAPGEMSCTVCDAQCRRVPGQVVGFCGDGVVDTTSGEVCEPDQSTTCAALDAGVGLSSCDPGCMRFQTAGCRDYQQVAVGSTGGCALDATGRVDCWGSLTAPAGRFKLLAAGPSFVCGVTADEAIQCWGGSISASLNAPASEVPVIAMAAGSNFLCALRGDGRDNTLSCSTAAPKIPDEAVGDYIQIAAGLSHVCGLTADGFARCWGTDPMGFEHLEAPADVKFSHINTSRQLSCGVTAPSMGVSQLRCWGTPTSMPPSQPLAPGTKVLLGAVGYGCTLDPDGAASCWGSSSAGAQSIDVRQRWRDLSLGLNAACGVSSQGAAVCWGENKSGQSAPPMVPARRVFAVDGLSCAIGVDGGARCWGNNSQGRQLFARDGVADMALGPEHTCALRDDDQVRCVARSAEGQLQLSAEERFTALAAGRGFTCGLLATGAVRCVGDARIAAQTPPDAGFVKLAAADRFACAMRQDGEVVCWGEGSGIAPPQGLRAASLARGTALMCALTTEGEARCWGVAALGEEGYAPLPGRSGIKRLASAGSHVCALLADDSASCVALFSASLTPPAGQFVEIAVGPRHACAVDSAGAVVCWGEPDEGARLPPALLK
jgi:alpha-tubulin suppressor-like RCC1 family protein